jgi:teichuronic acid biosynthesis protein TuaE
LTLIPRGRGGRPFGAPKPYRAVLSEPLQPGKALQLVFLALVACSFVGPALPAIPAGAFSIFPARILLVVVACLVAFEVARRPQQLEVYLPVRLYVLFFGIWLTYAAISLTWCHVLGLGLRELALLAAGIALVLFTVYSTRTEEHLRRLAAIWMSMFVALAVIGLWENISGNHLVLSGFYGLADERFRFSPTGPEHNPNDYALFLVSALPFVLGRYIYSSRTLQGMLYLFPLALGVYLLFATGSRSAVLSLCLDCLLLLVMTVSTQGSKRLARLLRACAFCVIVVAVNSIPLVLQYPQVTAVVPMWRQAEVAAEQIDGKAESIGLRWSLVQNGLEFVRETKGFGVGVGNTGWWMANRGAADTSGVSDPHNWWLDLLVTYGIAIAALFCLACLSLFISSVATWKLALDSATDWVRMGSTLSLAGMPLAVLGPSSVVGLASFWLVLGTALATVNVRRLQQRACLCTY